MTIIDIHHIHEACIYVLKFHMRVTKENGAIFFRRRGEAFACINTSELGMPASLLNFN